MKKYENPIRLDWTTLTERPKFDQTDLTNKVANILAEVKQEGDQALFKYAEKYDGAVLDELVVSDHQILQASKLITEELQNAIQIAYDNIYQFHLAQEMQEEVVETTQGVKCWRRSLPIEKVGLYIPGGSAPLFSTILMLGIPAKIANCQEVIICTPPQKDGNIHPAILYTAKMVGITKIYKVGGAQAVGAMAYGTSTIPQVYKIFGPGNQYVTKAKELVQQNGVAIDMPAGPSEVLVIADDTSIPRYVAADLLSQAEHGADSQVILLSNNLAVIDACLREVKSQTEFLPRKEIIKKALANSKSILLGSIEECIEFSNQYAPEHLIIASEKANDYIHSITNAGSVFVGNYSCESAGDYASGTNHTLPTNGFARNYSGVSLDSFVKKITFQELSKQGLLNIGRSIEIMAEAEELLAHKNAVSLRMDNNESLKS